MPIMLQGQEGYFSREVALEGSTFKIRELGDQELLAHLGAIAELRRLSGIEGVTAIPDIMEKSRVAGLTMPPEEQVALNTALRSCVDTIIAPGVVGWDLTAECTPDNRLLLPNWVKVQLAKEIMRDTNLSEEEEGFLPPPGSS